jgi:hypothetical protein
MSRDVQKLHDWRDGGLVQQAPWPTSSVPRRVFVKGMQGVDVTLIVTVVQGTVWVSISPPFTWEAIMEPVKVDELLHVLELARDEARKMPVVHNSGPSRPSKAAVRAITSSSKS